MTSGSGHDTTTRLTAVAAEAVQRGYQPLPIIAGGKRPYVANWTHLRWESPEQARASFEVWASQGVSGVGLLLGAPSGGLIDVDLDNIRSLKLRDHLLPPTAMQTGRAGRPRSHRWYRVQDADLPHTRRYKMPDNSVSVELRSTGSQTVIPPSIHPSGEAYRWEGPAWGGKKGPTLIDGKKLAIQVALLGLGAVLLDAWPAKGGRHDAYLALAGGLLRYGQGVHPYWERNLPILIDALADVTRDEEAGSRTAEVMGSTLTLLREGGKVTGFPRLAEMLGTDHAEQARRMAREVESLSGFTPEVMATTEIVTEALVSTLPPEERNPMEERISTWDSVDLEPYLLGRITMPDPSVLLREDGLGLFYPGRVNSLFGLSESGKSWIALQAVVQEMSRGDRVVYLDFEDEPAGTLARLRALGAGDDDIQRQFRYVHPEGPLADMQRYRFGQSTTEEGKQAAGVFRALLDGFDPTLIVADGMTALYGLHGHDTNEATGTDVITSWLKKLCRGGRTTVIVIDHTGKGGGAGSSPIGAHHKVAMVQGTALRADVVVRPMQGEVGIIRLIVYKDRPGVVRSRSTKESEQLAAEVEMDSTEPGVTRMRLKVPREGMVVIGSTPEQEAELARLNKVAELRDRVLALFEGDLDKKLTTVEVLNATGAVVTDIYDVWKALVAQGVIEQFGQSRWTHYKLKPPVQEKGKEKP